MSNIENKWRLEDEDGKPMAKKPDASNVIMYMNGKEIGRLQTLDVSTISNSIGSLGSFTAPDSYAQNITYQPVHNIPTPAFNITDEMIQDEQWDVISRLTRAAGRARARSIEVPIYRAFNDVRTETIREEVDRILYIMEDAILQYQERFHDRPSYVSLNRPAYRSLWFKFHSGEVVESTSVNAERFMGVPVICNPLQQLPVMALGNPIQEAIEGRLYE